MIRFEQLKDYYFTNSGDFYIENNDLSKTKNYEAFVQQIHSRMKSNKLDWALNPREGANVSDFVGKPNTREVGDKLKQRIYSELSRDNLVTSSELTVEVIPLSKTMVGVFLFIRSPRASGKIVLSYTYDLRDNRLIPRTV